MCPLKSLIWHRLLLTGGGGGVRLYRADLPRGGGRGGVRWGEKLHGVPGISPTQPLLGGVGVTGCTALAAAPRALFFTSA